MKNPGNLEPTGKGWTNWKQNLLIKGGPDVFFTMHKLNNGDTSYSVIVTGRYYNFKFVKNLFSFPPL